jgi:hypothetical protein
MQFKPLLVKLNGFLFQRKYFYHIGHILNVFQDPVIRFVKKQLLIQIDRG